MSRFGAQKAVQAPDDAREGATPSPRLPARLRLGTARDVRRELVRVYADARSGAIPTQAAARLCYVLGQIREAITAEDFEARLARLEGRKGA